MNWDRLLDWRVDWRNTVWLAVYRKSLDHDAKLAANLNDFVPGLVSKTDLAAISSPLEVRDRFLAQDPEATYLRRSIPDDLVQALLHELELRRSTARREWLARGPGWCRELQLLMDELSLDIALSESTIDVVLPQGEPRAWSENSASTLGWIAPVLYNVHPIWPEWLRVAWLLVRRHFETKILGSPMLEFNTTGGSGQRSGVELNQLGDLVSAILVAAVSERVDVGEFNSQEVWGLCKFWNLDEHLPMEPTFWEELWSQPLVRRIGSSR